jgi:hypothetical protein
MPIKIKIERYVNCSDKMFGDQSEKWMFRRVVKIISTFYKFGSEMVIIMLSWIKVTVGAVYLWEQTNPERNNS